MRALDEPLAVTGYGVACRLGHDLDSILTQLRSADVSPFTVCAHAVEHNARCRLYGPYKGDLGDTALGVERRAARFLGRASRLALVAAERALDMSGVDRRSVGVVVGSGTGDVATHLEMRESLARTRRTRSVGPTTIPKVMTSTVSANLAHVLACTGPSLSVSAACAGGAANLATAAMLLDFGHADVILAGGVECWDPHFHAGFDAMRAYSPDPDPVRASRPFAADRGGFLLGEGAGLVVLERASDAVARGAKVLGTLQGFGMSSDGTGQMVVPSGAGAIAAMRQALQHASITAQEVGYVNAHATGTPAGDVAEGRAIGEVFGAVPYGSTKGFTGHCISGAGAMEAVFTWCMLAEGWLAGCPNADPVAPELASCPPLLRTQPTAASVAVSNSFGFGGTNVSLVLGRGQPRPSAR
jgi:3-oxoacyl-[acyl-carrier-protein] synthase I